MNDRGYHLFCPLAFASELLEPRWTLLILLELFSGSTRFCDIQRGVPGMSPSLLSRRLKDMVAQGLLTRTVEQTGHIDYAVTPMGAELEPVIYAIASWGHRHIAPSVTLECLDHRLLMWNIRRKIDKAVLPRRKSVVEFILTMANEPAVHYWLILKPDAENDLCVIDPHNDVDLYVTADLRALTSAYMGHSSFLTEIDRGRISLIGNKGMADTITKWLLRSSLAEDTGERVRQTA